MNTNGKATNASPDPATSLGMTEGALGMTPKRHADPDGVRGRRLDKHKQNRR
jgi:hypothetical protein